MTKELNVLFCPLPERTPYGRAGDLRALARPSPFPTACLATAHQWRQTISAVLLHDHSIPLQYILENAPEALTAMLLTSNILSKKVSNISSKLGPPQLHVSGATLWADQTIIWFTGTNEISTG